MTDPNPELLQLDSGWSGLRLQLLAVISLFVGGVIVVAAKGPPLDGQMIGLFLAGLLLLAPLPMLAGDVVDALLIQAVRRRRISIDRYHATSPIATPGAVALVGIVVYPIVVDLGGVSLLSIFVVLGAIVLFAVIPLGMSLISRVLARRGAGSEPPAE